MLKSDTHNNLIALELAIKAAGMSIKLVAQLPSDLGGIRKQIINAADSAAGNLNEGTGRIGKDRLHFYRMSYASAREIDTHFRVVIEAEALTDEECEPVLDLWDRFRAVTWNLMKSVHT